MRLGVLPRVFTRWQRRSPKRGESSSSDKTIALLLPESKTTRYEAFDKPLFEAKVKELVSVATN